MLRVSGCGGKLLLARVRADRVASWMKPLQRPLAWCLQKALRLKNQKVLAAAIAERLAAVNGEVMLSAGLADALKLTPNALRLELSRGGDLPRPAPLPGKGHRWLTRDVAAWLAARSTTQDGPDEDGEDGRLDIQTADVDAPRRPGRPRKTTSAAPAQGGMDHV